MVVDRHSPHRTDSAWQGNQPETECQTYAWLRFGPGPRRSVFAKQMTNLRFPLKTVTVGRNCRIQAVRNVYYLCS